jgi:hypothetical protein
LVRFSKGFGNGELETVTAPNTCSEESVAVGLGDFLPASHSFKLTGFSLK